jgi:nucleoside-diphosphate-sugar epimerase
MSDLLIFGPGYSASVIARRLWSQGWRIITTSRNIGQTAEAPPWPCWETLHFDGSAQSPEMVAAIREATHALVSIPPDQSGDMVLRRLAADLAQAHRLKWIGYLSTIGVYGDHGGGWVDETTPPTPVSERSRQRLRAEQDWTNLSARASKPLDIFRLAGIYGPGRNVLDKLAAGMELQPFKTGQVFNRIHVEDIANVVEAAIVQANSVRNSKRSSDYAVVYNVTDNEPASTEDVTAYGASLLGAPPPPLIPLETAGLSEMARSFYGENKRVRNDRIKEWLGVSLGYPTYREGLAAILAAANLTR